MMSMKKLVMEFGKRAIRGLAIMGTGALFLYVFGDAGLVVVVLLAIAVLLGSLDLEG